MRQIGTVETLRRRIYPRYEGGGVGFNDDTVVVEPGVWPLYYNEQTGQVHWTMNGFANDPFEEIDRDEDSVMWSFNGDRPDKNSSITFDSVKFSIADFILFRNEDTVQPGPAQRLRITTNVPLGNL